MTSKKKMKIITKVYHKTKEEKIEKMEVVGEEKEQQSRTFRMPE